MQLPIYQSDEEQRLMVELWSPALADDAALARWGISAPNA